MYSTEYSLLYKGFANDGKTIKNRVHWFWKYFFLPQSDFAFVKVLQAMSQTKKLQGELLHNIKKSGKNTGTRLY